jgi:uncharacterized repeat protein (TIGR03843 family)
MSQKNEETLLALRRGKIDVQGEFLWGSNYTFLVKSEYEGKAYPAVYKPVRGERPLWDFPVATLARREVAAYLVSEALGPGSIQLFVEHDPEYHYFNFSEADQQRLRPTALFDLLINNADRKGSHILIDPQNHIWLIDHGVTFHVEEKLRTVIWDFAGEQLPDDLCTGLEGFVQKLRQVNLQAGETPPELSEDPLVQLTSYINKEEIKALLARAEALVKKHVYPPPNPYRRPYPWPQI